MANNYGQHNSNGGQEESPLKLLVSSLKLSVIYSLIKQREKYECCIKITWGLILYMALQSWNEHPIP